MSENTIPDFEGYDSVSSDIGKEVVTDDAVNKARERVLDFIRCEYTGVVDDAVLDKAVNRWTAAIGKDRKAIENLIRECLDPTVLSEIDDLKDMSPNGLNTKFKNVFGGKITPDDIRSNFKDDIRLTSFLVNNDVIIGAIVYRNDKVVQDFIESKTSMWNSEEMLQLLDNGFKVCAENGDLSYSGDLESACTLVSNRLPVNVKNSINNPHAWGYAWLQTMLPSMFPVGNNNECTEPTNEEVKDTLRKLETSIAEDPVEKSLARYKGNKPIDKIRLMLQSGLAIIDECGNLCPTEAAQETMAKANTVHQYEQYVQECSEAKKSGLVGAVKDNVKTKLTGTVDNVKDAIEANTAVNKASRESMKRRRAEATEAAKAYTGKEYEPEEVYEMLLNGEAELDPSDLSNIILTDKGRKVIEEEEKDREPVKEVVEPKKKVAEEDTETFFSGAKAARKEQHVDSSKVIENVKNAKAPVLIMIVIGLAIFVVAALLIGSFILDNLVYIAIGGGVLLFIAALLMVLGRRRGGGMYNTRRGFGFRNNQYGGSGYGGYNNYGSNCGNGWNNRRF